jgi:signal transduction histidine kinase
VVFGLLIALVSFGFSIAIGLWITSLSEYANERAALVDDLTSAQAEIAALNRERGAYAERERLARDLHDTLAQSLAGLVMLAERARRQSQEGRTAAATQSTAQLEDVARTALVEARVLVARTAAVPAEPAFGTAVERLVERFRSEAGLVIDLSAADVSADRETQVVVLRCLQEALANVRKHAGASRVSVRVELVGTAVELVVADDGRGFDQDHREGGFGLDGMGERVRIVGGRLDVTSEPGAGTEVRVRLPLPEHAP